MQSLELPEIGATTSVVGFGCGGLGARLSSDESLQLLRAAADRGVRHLDVARSYGYGYAEAVVGRLLRGHRDEFFVVSKAGVLPPAQSTSRRLAVVAARRVVRNMPRLRRHVSRRAGGSLTPTMDVASLRRSLEQTLSALKTDYLDVLMLHECAVGDLTDDVVTWLESVVVGGQARAWGTATTAEHTADVLRVRSPFAVNLPSSASDPRHELLEVPGVRMKATHSALGGDIGPVMASLRVTATREKWEDLLEEPLPPESAACLLLRAARARNPGGVALAGTQRLDHVASLADAGAGTPQPELAALVEGLVREARSAQLS